jgi:transcriptional regulator with PAS, ATPase and Fis domain
MGRHLLLMLTGDNRLADRLALMVEPACELHVTPRMELVPSELERLRPKHFVADFRQVHAGGHIEDAWLDRMSAQFPDVQVVMLTSPQCPEPLERRAAITPSLITLQADTTLADLDLSALAAHIVPAAASPIDHNAEVVLEGVTRRFETNSPELKRMLQDLAVAAAHDVTILLIGETGSGKTFLSNLIHEASPRRNEPFLHIACGALPRELIESEMFGHSKGSFTSAHADKEGKFVAARRGTMLLDEIDVLGLEQQVKLLRVIETGEFEPVGSNITLKSQARLVVASNLDLEPLVEQGKFRPDLYYRLNMLKFVIPPLRERRADIIPLAKKFITRFEEKHQLQVRQIEDPFFHSLLSYPWPGNVRELEHVIQRAVIYSRDGVLQREQLPPHILSGAVGPSNDPNVAIKRRIEVDETTLEQQMALTEKELIEHALLRNSFSRTNTAKDLGISRVTLYNKMKKYNMTR